MTTTAPYVKSLTCLFIVLLSTVTFGQSDAIYQVGFAKVDITPDYPVRLNGFGFRREESEGVSQSVFARAMAISQTDAPPLVIIAVDNLGLRLPQVDRIAEQLKQSRGLPRENFALTFSHSHCAPKVNGASDNIFSQAIPPEHQEHLDRYSEEIIGLIVQAATEAIDSRQPATLHRSTGTVGFAKNRRPMGGPTDHDLPTLIARDPNTQAVRGVYVSYACHCVTLRFNQISGDWAGYAAEGIERQFPDSVALVSIGAGSDQNPIDMSVDDVSIAQRQGAEIASEVKRLAETKALPISGPLSAQLQRISLPLNPLPSREQFAELAEKNSNAAVRYNATTQLAKLDRGEPLLTEIDYPIQTFVFGNSLCMSFLAGEVCVDYSIRLKSEIDRKRYWLNTYSNDFCSYIPSERLVGEGGYGGGAEVPYFALPTTLAAGLEQRIVDEVHRQVPDEFVIPEGVQGVAPKSPKDALQSMQTHDDLEIELVAAEPLVRDPVAIDFGVDGSVWVAQMSDYGRGVYEKFEHHGQVRRLSDTTGDGQFDKAVTFVDGLRFPTDVKVWRDGLLICDAPDILLARDTDGDGVADSVDKLFSGFEIVNAQARVNSLRWGIDNWIYGSCGLFGGKILSHKTGQTHNIVGRDFRMNPDTGEIQAVAGRTQQGRSQNDWGDWFGCTNSSLLLHYASDARYDSRNALVSLPTPTGLTGGAETRRLFPPEELVQFALSGASGNATAACGLDIYRDNQLGEEYLNNAFTCEPVNQLVHRSVLQPTGIDYQVSRGANETESEFLTSTDRWFRPVQARTGPDGSLWVVDMYRYVIEHSRWIPQATLAELDVYAGQSMGRIYRVRPKSDQPAAPTPAASSAPFDLTGKSDLQLAMLLKSSNGTVRDLAHQMLFWNSPSDPVADQLRAIVAEAPLAASRIHALALLSAWQKLDAPTLLVALANTHDEVVRHGIRFAEPMLDDDAALRDAVIRHAAHASPRVRRQVAWSLGELKHASAIPALTALASKTETDRYVRAAAISSLNPTNVSAMLAAYVALPPAQQQPESLQQILRTAIRLGDAEGINASASQVLPAIASDDAAANRLLIELLDSADARIGNAKIAWTPELKQAVQEAHRRAIETLDPNALALLGRYRGAATTQLLTSGDQPSVADELSMANVLDAISQRVSARHAAPLQVAAINALAKTRHPDAAELLLERYREVSASAQAAILDNLIARNDWSLTLLDTIAEGDLRANILDADRRGKLLSHADETIRQRAKSALEMAGSPSRAAILDTFKASLKLAGDVDRGRAVFRKQCSACHRVEEHGFVVGPDLTALTNRDPQWMLSAILDPNREVDARYVSWSALSEDGRVLSGLVVEENAAMIRLRESGGKEHELLRDSIEQLRASDRSLMPEGLEKDMTTQEVSDLIAYVIHSIGTPAPMAADQPLPRQAHAIAPFLLDESQSIERRQQAIDQRPGMGPAILNLLAVDLRADDLATQYKRIPWIWRVALAIGRRSDDGELHDALESSLPRSGDPLLDWQAVVIGGGLINGLTQIGQWPSDRIAAILDADPSLAPRWQQTLAMSAAMADDDAVKNGTRYDALRIVALDDPEKAIPHLKRYLGADINGELQMGAVSGLADIDAPQIAALLIESLPGLTARNRQLAIEGLLRTPTRREALKAAFAKDAKLLTAEEAKQLAQP
ncbi:neutral/alkaline non-lysosomal ceramidase N-terminal domain-containing protein [Rosistilla oblonga]|uniref:neutral/alkaline non-lysosomal ceramidase N-terminal domain-containing protein n=1 Tax=Rosistilla oblonga TaxID=2527990 RepID=UPI003A986B95